MGRADYRRGSAPLRTASELSALLPVPLLLITEGFAQPLFPNSDPAHASPFVVIKEAKSSPRLKRVGLPIFIHWTQWKEVVAPVLEYLVTYRWRGKLMELGDSLELLQDVIGPNGELVFSEGDSVGDSLLTKDRVGTLYACDPPWSRESPASRTSSYLLNLSRIILQFSIEAGY